MRSFAETSSNGLKICVSIWGSSLQFNGKCREQNDLDCGARGIPIRGSALRDFYKYMLPTRRGH